MNLHTYCLCGHLKSIVKFRSFGASCVYKSQDCGFSFSQQKVMSSFLLVAYSVSNYNNFFSTAIIAIYSVLLDTLEPFSKTNKLNAGDFDNDYFQEKARKKVRQFSKKFH